MVDMQISSIARKENETTLSFIEVREPRDLDGAIEEKENEWCNRDEKTGFTPGEIKFPAIFQMHILLKPLCKSR